MSFTIDANIFVYAANTTADEHEAALAALHEARSGREDVVIFWPVVLAFLRLSTHLRMTSRPLEPEEAFANMRSFLDGPRVRLVADRPEGFEALHEAARQVRARGALMQDAYIAALMWQHEVRTIWTHDRDFRLFDGIRVVDPVASPPPSRRGRGRGRG